MHAKCTSCEFTTSRKINLEPWPLIVCMSVSMTVKSGTIAINCLHSCPSDGSSLDISKAWCRCSLYIVD